VTRTLSAPRSVPRMRRLCLTTAVVTTLLLGCPSVAAAAGVNVASSGILQPAFDRSAANYATTCVGGRIQLKIKGSQSLSTKIDSRKTTKGSVTTSISLKAGRRAILRLTDSAGTTTHSIRCMPSDFPKLSSTGLLPASIPLLAIDDISGRSRYGGAPNSYGIIVDRHGAPIWWRREGSSLVNFFATTDGHLALGHSGGALEIRTLRGTLTESIRPANADTDAHEAIPTARGTWFMAVHSRRAAVDLTPIGMTASESVLDSTIVEVDASGKVLWSWNSADHIATRETLLSQITPATATSSRVVDLTHVNSFEEDEHGGLIASFRETGAVYRIRLSDGSIDWKLGGTTTPQSLSVLGDPGIGEERHLLGQHDARLLPDGTLSIFDNGSILFTNGFRESRAARALRLSIDPVGRTATVVESLRDLSIGSSACCGSARLMPDASWLVAWGATPYIRSYNSGGTSVFSLRFVNATRFTYRATPILSPTITEAAVVAGMDALVK